MPKIGGISRSQDGRPISHYLVFTKKATVPPKVTCGLVWRFCRFHENKIGYFAMTIPENKINSDNIFGSLINLPRLHSLVRVAAQERNISRENKP